MNYSYDFLLLFSVWNFLSLFNRHTSLYSALDMMQTRILSMHNGNKNGTEGKTIENRRRMFLFPFYLLMIQTVQCNSIISRIHDNVLAELSLETPIASGGKLPVFEERQSLLASRPASLQTAQNSVDSPVSTLPEELRNEIKAICLLSSCKGQSEQAVEDKATLRQQLISLGHPSADVDLQLEKTQELKKTILEGMGLEDLIEPEDDGLYQGDILLTTEQAEEIIQSIKQKEHDGNSRQKRSGVYSSKRKWDISRKIKYMIAPELEAETENITRSIIEIQLRVHCLQFERITYAWDEEKHQVNFPALGILFRRKGKTCISHMGYNAGAINVINLGEGCMSVPIILHEILHSLGVSHMHTRADRDQFLLLNMRNVDKKKLSNFDISNPAIFSVYGIEYDFLSLMHYPQNSFAIDPKKPTMVAKKEYANMQQRMGSAPHLRDSDVTLLNRMYCAPEGCVDKQVKCGLMALYADDYNRQWLIDNCRRSMGCVFH